MNLNPKNWYYPQWITTLALLLFFFILPKTHYALFGSLKYGGITLFTVCASILFIYAHLHNFGLVSDLTLGQLLLRFAPSLCLILGELFLVIVMAIVFKSLIYWKEIFRFIAYLLIYMVTVVFCHYKVETRSVTFEELLNRED